MMKNDTCSEILTHLSGMGTLGLGYGTWNSGTWGRGDSGRGGCGDARTRARGTRACMGTGGHGT